MRTHAVAALACAAALALAACAEPEDRPGEERTDAPGPTAEEPTSPELTTEPEDPTTAPSDEFPGEVEAAVADLAEHLGVAPEDIAVVSYADVTWPDGAIGCPQPGMSYTQALVPGSRLVLEVEGTEYAYHAGSEPDLVRCDDPRAPVEDEA